jgi:hypothetical protein
VHSAGLILGSRKTIPKHKAKNIFFFILLSSLPLGITKHHILFKLICK